MKNLKIIIIVFLLLTTAFVFINSWKDTTTTYYDSKESALNSLLGENIAILESIEVNESKVVAILYDKLNEAIFMATIHQLNNNSKFVVENKTNSWRIGGDISTLISGVYEVDSKKIIYYAWKGYDTLKQSLAASKVIEQNKNKVKNYYDEIYLLVLH